MQRCWGQKKFCRNRHRATNLNGKEYQMDTIRLRGDRFGGNTIISNCFIDNFLADANGAQLKIYLYLTRCIGSDTPVDVSSIADRFNYTEKDVRRALNYWAKAGIITLEFDADREISGITLNDPADAASLTVPAEEPSITRIVEPLYKEKKPERKKPGYSEAKISSFGKKAEVRELIFAVETYTRQTLSRKDMENLLFMYDELKFPVDLIEFLIEHCLESGGSNMSYFMEVAYSWNEKGIHTTEEAREYLRFHNNNVYAVMKEFGIKDRSITRVESDYLEKWKKQYGFDIDIIKDAAGRTIKRTGKASFPYADKILTEWHEKGVKTPDDIKKLDEIHEENKRSKYQTVRNTPVKPHINRFKNFSEREYDDMSLIEEELLSKSMAKAGRL